MNDSVQEKRHGDSQIRDRMTTLEVKFDNHARQMTEVVETQRDMNDKIDKLLIFHAEARGAGKVAKFIWGILAALAGYAGGTASGVAKHL